MTITPLRIYLADLTYTTLSLATEAFPLNVGFVAAYAKKRFGAEVEVRLFKYIGDLEEALSTRAPDVLGMSNYPWNASLGQSFFRRVAAEAPLAIRVMGGPNISQSASERIEFMRAHPLVDCSTVLEGEEAFANIVERILSVGLEKSRCLAAPLPGCVSRNGDVVVEGDSICRRKNLDEIPSPYLTGLLDPFFDGILSPMIETNRGCPFSCLYCHEGHPLISQVNYFGLDRVKEELSYIARKIGSSVSNLLIADPNFGMYERDLEICSHIALLKKSYGWPRFIFASAGKNRKDRVAEAARILDGSMKLWLSVQSMDSAVLKAIKRDNISFDQMMALKDECESNGITTVSELILGLPEDTFSSHLSSVSKLIDLGIDQITTYTCMLLEGTELATRECRERYGIGSHFRVLPRDFARLADGTIVVETEEVLTSTTSLSFEEYLRLRTLHLLVNVVNNGKPLGPLFRFMRESGVPTFELFTLMLEDIASAPDKVRRIVDSFNVKTREELWKSRDELIAFMTRTENYERLLAGDLGANLIQTHTAMSGMEMERWCDFVFACAARLPLDSGIIADIRSFCGSRVRALWSEDRHATSPECTLRHDIASWYRAEPRRRITEFRLEPPRRFRFGFTEEQQRTQEEYLARFGSTPTGIGRILMKADMTRIWREKIEMLPPE